MNRDLQVMVSDSTVRIHVDDGRSGTGFFVGGGLVLTCSHVVAPAKTLDPKVEVVGPRAEWHTSPIKISLASQHDLALLATTHLAHPCVLFGPAAEIGQDVWSQGYIENSTRILLDPIVGRMTGESTEQLKAGGPPIAMIKFTHAKTVPGMSGAPLVNLANGCVCGVVARTLDRTSDEGGRAIPVRYVMGDFPEVAVRQSEQHGRDSPWRRIGVTLPSVNMTVEAKLHLTLTFPPGPAVPVALVPPDLLARFYDLQAGESLQIVQAANHLRTQTDRATPPYKITVAAPDPAAVTVPRFWLSVFTSAAARGPRMLAALLYEAPPGAYSGLETEVLDLLAVLRSWPVDRGG